MPKMIMAAIVPTCFGSKTSLSPDEKNYKTDKRNQRSKTNGKILSVHR